MTDLETLRNQLKQGDITRIADDLHVHRNTVQNTLSPNSDIYNSLVIDRALELILDRYVEQAHNDGKLTRTLALIEQYLTQDKIAS